MESYISDPTVFVKHKVTDKEHFMQKYIYQLNINYGDE